MVRPVFCAAKGGGVTIGRCGPSLSDDDKLDGFKPGRGIGGVSFNPHALLKAIGKLPNAEESIS